MQKIRKIIIFSLLLFLVLSCSVVSNSSNGSSLQIILPSSQRSAIPSNLSYYEITVSLNDFSVSKSNIKEDSIVTFDDLSEGLYTVEVFAFDENNKKIGEGKEKALIEDEKITSVSIKMRLVSESSNPTTPESEPEPAPIDANLVSISISHNEEKELVENVNLSNFTITETYNNGETRNVSGSNSAYEVSYVSDSIGEILFTFTYKEKTEITKNISVSVYYDFEMPTFSIEESLTLGDGASLSVTSSDSTIPTIKNESIASAMYWLSYQWYKDEEQIPGATNSSYIPSTAGTYKCVVSVSPTYLSFCKKENASVNSNVSTVTSNQIGTFAELISALSNATNGDTITLTQNLTATSSVTLGSSKNITIDGSNFSITRDSTFTGTMFSVNDGVLTLKNITLDGNKSVVTATRPLAIVSGGKLVLSSNCILKDNKNSTSSSFPGGAINVSGSSSTLEIEGGRIVGNETINVDGGGIYSTGTVNFISGSITGNKAKTSYEGMAQAGGVYTSGTFTMSGGDIRANFANSAGGAVLINGGTFTMEDGIVSGDSSYGGAFFISSGKLIRSSYAQISGTSSGSSKPIYLQSGTYQDENGNEYTTAGSEYN